MPGKLTHIKETRECSDIRADGPEGVVKAYLTKWGTIDSYNSTFIRGSFKKTFSERGSKIKLLYNHDPLAGKVLRTGEDEVGPWVEVQFNLDTQTGSDAFAHIRAKDIDCFSFGFNILQARKNADGVTEILEVRCFEVSPVVFEANSEAKIVEIRAEDFNETLDISTLRGEGWRAFDALANTIDDIMWNDNTPDEVLSKIDTAIGDFHMMYMQWLNDYLTQFRDDIDAAMMELRHSPDEVKNELRSVNKDELISSTSLTKEEFETLQRGDLLKTESRKKLSDLPDNIREAHQRKRVEAVSTLCDELRESGFTDLERERFRALLGIPTAKATAKRSDDNVTTLLNAIDSLKL